MLLRIRPDACPASITVAVGLSTIITIAARKRATAIWKKIFEPKRWPSLPPSMTNPDTPSEYITIAVPTVVGGGIEAFHHAAHGNRQGSYVKGHQHLAHGDDDHRQPGSCRSTCEVGFVDMLVIPSCVFFVRPWFR